MDINYYRQFEPIDGKWYITKKLGKGSFGTVFEIERRDYANMKSALKVITIPASSADLKSFRSDNFDMDDESVKRYFYAFVDELLKNNRLDDCLETIRVKFFEDNSLSVYPREKLPDYLKKQIKDGKKGYYEMLPIRIEKGFLQKY